MNWLGLDIGGANLKAANGQGWARSVPFPLWRDPAGLSTALAAIIDAGPAADGIAVTMTGELCDCFRTKTDGVLQILDASERASKGRQVLIYLVDGQLVSLEEARWSPELAAASNWHVLAGFAAHFVKSDVGMLIDVGSTTTDFVPIIRGRPQPSGFGDTNRLLTGELVYSGVGRTPICALTTWLPWQGRHCPIAAELFATTSDAYILLGDLPEQPDNTNTADGRPLTREFARERLARMICADRTTFTNEDARIAAGRVREAQFEQFRDAAQMIAEKLPERPMSIVVTGAGEFLAIRVCRETWSEVQVTSLAGCLGREASQCGPAYALAVLASEKFG